jgi:alpha-aminoadipate carrier protein LysW
LWDPHGLKAVFRGIRASKKAATKRVLQNPTGTVRLSAIRLTEVEVSRAFVGWATAFTISAEVLKVPTGTCPECDADVHVDMDTDKGDIVSCEECGTSLEIVGLDPVELDIVEEEDYDEDEDEDEY